MKHLDLDFIEDGATRSVPGIVAVLIGLMLLGLELLYVTGRLQTQQEHLTSHLEAQQRVLRPVVPVSRWKADELVLLTKAAHQIDGELNLPWQDLFSFMDNASGKDLNLLSLEPDSNKGQLILTAEARDYSAMLDFYAAMQASKLFSDVALQSHVVNQNVAELPIRFRLRARWMIHE